MVYFYPMKTILCYGDSNTYGYDPASGTRYPMDVRWPGVLRSELGEGYHVIEEGLGGRTTVWDDEIEEHRNGKTYLYPCIESHAPLDLVIIFLGTNDLKYRFHLGAFDIAESVGKLVDIVRRSDAGTGGRAPGVLVICPSVITETGELVEMFRDGRKTSLGFRAEFTRMCGGREVPLLFADDVAQVSPIDGVHFSPDAQKAIGRMVASGVRELVFCR